MYHKTIKLFCCLFFTDVSVQDVKGTSESEDDIALDKTSDITITNEGTVQFTVTANSDTFDEGVEVFEISMVNAQLVSGSGEITTNNAIIYVYNFAPGLLVCLFCLFVCLHTRSVRRHTWVLMGADSKKTLKPGFKSLYAGLVIYGNNR